MNRYLYNTNSYDKKRFYMEGYLFIHNDERSNLRMISDFVNNLEDIEASLQFYCEPNDISKEAE